MAISRIKTKAKRMKRVGRGIGSGKGGHTTGRGQKGQKSRSSLHILFEGTKVKKSLLKRLPLRRGKGKNKPVSNSPIIVKLSLLNLFPSGSSVDVEALISKNIVRRKDALTYGVKILGDGKLEKKLTVKLPTSKSVAQEIKKAGGEVVSR